MTVFEKLRIWVVSHPLYAILLVVAVGLLVFVAANGIGRSIEIYRENRFDKIEAAHEREVVDLKVERDAAVKRADTAEAMALLKAKEAAEYKQMIDANGGKLAKSAADLEKAIEEARRGAGTCNGDAECLCQKLQQLGINCN